MSVIKTEQKRFFEQVEKEAAANPILQVLYRYFNGRQDIIYQMRAEVCSNETLHTFISNAFGIWGGASLEDGWYEYSGGNRPRLLLKDKEHNTIQKLEGQQLVATFRSLYRIPKDGQLDLF